MAKQSRILRNKTSLEQCRAGHVAHMCNRKAMLRQWGGMDVDVRSRHARRHRAKWAVRPRGRLLLTQPPHVALILAKTTIFARIMR